MSVTDIVIAPRRVAAFLEHRGAAASVGDQRRTEQAIETAMSLGPCGVVDEVG